MPAMCDASFDGSTLLRRMLPLAAACLLFVNHAGAAEAPYPFEGTWVQTDHVCNAATTRSRTYTAKEVASTRSHCSIRRVSAGSGIFELLEDCRRNDRPEKVTETIRMTSPDSFVLRRQLVRLKIPRPVRYMRCSVAAGAVSPAPAPAAARPARPAAPDAAHRTP